MTRGSMKKVSMDDIAKFANVSKVTVSRALSGHKNVTPATRKKIMDIAREHGYAVNRNAQKLRERHTNTVAVILDFPSHKQHRISDPFIFELLAGVSEALSIKKQDLLLSPPELTDANSYRHLVLSRAVDGFIFLGQGDKENLLKELSETDVPIVVWGAQTPENLYCTVGSDNFLGGHLAGKRFVEQERRNILFIGNTKHLEIKLRRDGLLSALESADYEYTADELKSDGFSFLESYDALLKHLENHTIPDAIFAYSDTSAMAAINAMKQHRLEPMRDYSLIGYNDIVQSAHYSPPLSTIKQDTYLAGALLVEKYMSLIDGNAPASSTIPTELITRFT